MAIEIICYEEFIDGKIYEKKLGTTHIKVEGRNFVQYHCNPSPEPGMKEVHADIANFIAREKKAHGHLYSRVIETIGGKISTTYHYHN